MRKRSRTLSNGNGGDVAWSGWTIRRTRSIFDRADRLRSVDRSLVVLEGQEMRRVFFQSHG
jgi:hypothetical protein